MNALTAGAVRRDEVRLTCLLADDAGVWVGDTHGTVLRYAAGTWSDVSPPTHERWTALWASGDQLVAAGDSGRIARYDGTSWFQIAATGAEGLAGLGGVSAKWWAVGRYGTILEGDVD